MVTTNVYTPSQYPQPVAMGSNMNAGMELPGTRAPQVEMEFMEFQATLDGLLDKLGALSQRLAPVLRESSPRNENAKEVAQPPLVPLAERLRHNRLKVAVAHRLLDDVMERLEI